MATALSRPARPHGPPALTLRRAAEGPGARSEIRLTRPCRSAPHDDRSSPRSPRTSWSPDCPVSVEGGSPTLDLMDGQDEPAPTPTRMWFALLRRLGRGLAGRRISVRDTAATVVSMHGKPDGSGWSFGRARDVQVVLRDVTAPELEAQELVVECDALVVGPTVTATGVRVTATMSPDALAAYADDDEPSPRVDVVDGEFRTPWLPGIDLVLQPEITEDDLRFTPTAVITPLGRWSSWGILPSGTTASAHSRTGPPARAGARGSPRDSYDEASRVSIRLAHRPTVERFRDREGNDVPPPPAQSTIGDRSCSVSSFVFTKIFSLVVTRAGREVIVSIFRFHE